MASTINPAYYGKDTKHPQTLCRIVWADGEKTWMTRTLVRRLFGNGPKYGDKKIFENMQIHVERFEEAMVKKTRAQQSRSPTPFVGRSRTSTRRSGLRSQQQVKAGPKNKSRNQAKELQGTRKREPLSERSEKGNAKAARNGRKGKPSVDEKAEPMSREDFMKFWADEVSKPGGMARVAREWQNYRNEVEAEAEEEEYQSGFY